MRRNLAPIFVCLICLFGTLSLATFTGCAKLRQVLYAPGADPVVVEAERLAETSLVVMEKFVAWERKYEEPLALIDHRIHLAAETVRENGLGYVEKLRTATKVYKAAKTAVEKASAKLDLDLAQSNVQNIVTDSQNFQTQNPNLK